MVNLEIRITHLGLVPVNADQVKRVSVSARNTAYGKRALRTFALSLDSKGTCAAESRKRQ